VQKKEKELKLVELTRSAQLLSHFFQNKCV